MLSLTLKEGEYLMIGDDIRVQFLEDQSAKCIRIGVDAPKAIPIARSKPYEKALAVDTEANAMKLEEIERRKQIHAIEKQKSADKERERKRRAQARLIEKAEQCTTV